MFEEDIAHAQDMIRRLDAEGRLADADKEALPPYRRVPRQEATAWRQALEAKLRSAFGPDTFARYHNAWELYTDELKRDEGDDYSRAINAKTRIVALLQELDSRAPIPVAAPTVSQSHPGGQGSDPPISCAARLKTASRDVGTASSS
jgi:hypothetical protein